MYELMVQSVHIALQHLYRPSLHLVNANNSRAVMATALLFGGMPELVEQGYRTTSESISVENAVDLVNWVNRPLTQTPPNGDHGVNGASQNGADRYGEWSSRLRGEV